MYDWTDTEISRRHREELLRNIERRRITPGLRADRKRRASLVSLLRWEMARDLDRVAHLFRTRHARH